MIDPPPILGGAGEGKPSDHTLLRCWYSRDNGI